ncbi:hypothetical protein B0H34DRAFT_728585 [Crassisporium funariophilum]|nr:hypothetical protein B0H34DRAFT_736094 [Crassisporium funariophilum]KAF8148615.1 hypothetical protein B0H34DRAFT_736244 [Crassisporium funariophilum]KAF8148621.1 hypothetical protein B0H34DRAFT_736272 [Crassisporium funariophilum]KAF8151689.1 hypothetical protein B0H34DRAFT_728585 [Crassisporium funariophilum]
MASLNENGKFLNQYNFISLDAAVSFRRQQLHDAIETLHEVGIHHHDLKTDNVMRNSEGDIRVIDFSHAECCNDVDREVCPDWWWINGVRPDTL